MTEHRGKVAIVTGGASGIGQAVVETFLQKEIKVCIADYNDAQGEKVCAELRSTHGKENVTFIKCDVSDSAQLENVFKRTMANFGRLDIVCNNAGIMDESKLQQMLLINLGAVIEGTNLGIKYMGKDAGGRGGVVINTASGAGLMPFYPAPAYAGTKFAVIGFSRSVATDPRRAVDGVKVNVLCPAYTDTNLIKVEDNPGAVTDVDAFKTLGSYAPYATPSYVAEQFLLLLNETAENGSVLALSRTGPRLLKLPMSYSDFETKA